MTNQDVASARSGISLVCVCVCVSVCAKGVVCARLCGGEGCAVYVCVLAFASHLSLPRVCVRVCVPSPPSPR